MLKVSNMHDAVEKRAIETLLPPASGASIDELLGILADERRRALVSVLATRDDPGPVDIEELSRAVVALETNTDATDVAEDDLRRVRLTLHHVHLPKMADYGLISYDQDRKAVALADGLLGTDSDGGVVSSKP